MSTTQPASNVTALRRPAVHASTVVRSDLDHTFDGFVRTIAAWWPLPRASAGRERARDVVVEDRVGGRVFETWDDGTIVEWGRLVAWNPPHGFTMSWNSATAATEVELAFTAVGPSLTRVSVEHRGWEQLTDEQLAADCGAPGGYAGGGYDNGWRLIIDSFAHYMQAHTDPVAITDEHMLHMRTTTKPFTFVLLSRGPEYGTPGSDKIIWEHGRRNFRLRAQGILSIVCPVTDGSERCGIAIFDAPPDQVDEIMRNDPGVKAGLFTYELHSVRSFPGDKLPL